MKRKLENLLFALSHPAAAGPLSMLVVICIFIFTGQISRSQIVWQGRQTITNLLSLQSVNGTNNGAWFLIGTVTIPQTAFLFQNSGLPSTNANTNYIQFGLDTNYAVTEQTYKPGATNATIDMVTITNNVLNIYGRVQVTTTNPENIGVQALKSQ